jgi:hypothetical protein
VRRRPLGRGVVAGGGDRSQSGAGGSAVDGGGAGRAGRGDGCDRGWPAGIVSLSAKDKQADDWFGSRAGYVEDASGGSGFACSARVSTFRTHQTRPGRAPSIARGRWWSSRPTTIIGLRRSHPSNLSLRPATTTHPCEALLHEPSTRVQAIRPSGLRLAGSLWMEQEPLGLPPGFAPRDHSQRTPRRGRIIEHGPEICSTASAQPPTSRICCVRATSRRTRASRSRRLVGWRAGGGSRSLRRAWRRSSVRAEVYDAQEACGRGGGEAAGFCERRS